MVALTNASQQVVARYQYGAYGNIVSSGLVSGDAALTDSTDLAQQNANPFRFSTKWLHSTSGLYDYGFRFYSPGLARFINRDPIREAGGLNVYGFVGNNPINRVDAHGLSPRNSWDSPEGERRMREWHDNRGNPSHTARGGRQPVTDLESAVDNAETAAQFKEQFPSHMESDAGAQNKLRTHLNRITDPADVPVAEPVEPVIPEIPVETPAVEPEISPEVGPGIASDLGRIVGPLGFILPILENPSDPFKPQRDLLHQILPQLMKRPFNPNSPCEQYTPEPAWDGWA